MDWLGTSICSTFTVMIVLGIPLFILYAFGWYIYEVGRRQPFLPASRREKRAGKYSPGASRSSQQMKCWDVKDCPTGTRETCPAAQNPDVSCWQAVKTAFGGRIKEDCPRCQMFLSR
jgi:hypothetical protein